jgi:membrane protease YdiL (CAAX protease family)
VKPTGTGRGENAALLFAMAFPSAAAWLYFVVFADRGALATLYTIAKAIQFLFPVVWILLSGETAAIGARLRPRGLASGLVSGLGIVAALWIVYLGWLAGGALAGRLEAGVRIKLEQMGAVTPVRYLVLAVFLAVIHSFLEEYYWRWFVYGRLRRRLGETASLIVSSLGFMAHHVIILHAFLGWDRWPATAVLSLAVAAGGALWAGMYARSGSLAGPWLSHMLVDLGVLGLGYHLVGGMF